MNRVIPAFVSLASFTLKNYNTHESSAWVYAFRRTGGAAEVALLFRIPAHRDFVRSVRFDHQRIVSCGDDGRVCVFSFDGRGNTEERRSGELSDRARRVSIHGE